MCSVLYLSSPTQIELFLIHIFLECILKKKITVYKKMISNSTVLNIDNNKKAPNQHIKMISEGSCDTED